MAESMQPIIIRRKKVYAADGHHGGAWKVAYADFVTAMMAFFLLMWLLNATTEEQRKGIADYFSPSIPLAAVSGGGSGALSGDTMLASDTLLKNGTGTPPPTANTKIDDEENQRLEDKIKDLNAAIAADKSGLSEHIKLKMSPEGLVIELIDGENRSLFSIGSSEASPLLHQLSVIIAEAFKTVKNPIKIVGHTDALAFINTERYSNWDLSTDRANTARRTLMRYGFPTEQISELSGKAYTDPMSTDQLAPQNRRISITLLRGPEREI